MTFDVVVLAGGRAQRLGGGSKADVVVAGRTLLDRALDAAAGARHVVVVAPPGVERPGTRRVLEDPPSGGPVAGIEAALRALPEDDAPVLVLACDVPRAAAAVGDLLAALADGADGAHLVDDEGHAQLVAVYRRAPLRRALATLAGPSGTVHGASVRRLHAHLVLTAVPDAGRGADADTWDDVHRLDALLERRDTMDTTRDPDLPEPFPGPPGLPDLPDVPGIPDLPDVPGAAGAPAPRGSVLHRWLVSVADTLGVDPDALDVEALLDLSRDVAHGVARPAVPLTSFLAGYAVATAGGDREAFDRVVDRVGALAAEWAAAAEEGEDPAAATASVPPAS
ncbi:NTP transferase domain-containing protein [Actinotalea solisilvae]|uniref:NTP transferase domain-containing protein n=1 Tax=Actinotalea solisilvae TaxID=2072922 RepID=UPI0027DB3ACE|nr:NTP transferase domain-containing protein [Actinotalea solisilvae]